MKPEAPATVPTLLYADCSLQSGIDRKRLDGMRRYAAARRWRVEHEDCSPAALREALARLRPVGCAAECWCPGTAPRPAVFGRVPVVYFSPPDRPGWRKVRGISCDEAAVARMAFDELSSTDPPSYAVVSFGPERRWARERVEAFVERCREAGAVCAASSFPLGSAGDFPRCVDLMVPWAASLPQRCAVFAVNDLCAIAAANAMAEAGRSFPRSVTLVGADGDDPPPWDRKTAETVSSVRLDHELAGYLAAKMLGERAGIVHKSSIDNCSQVANGKSNSKIDTCGQLSQFPIVNNPDVSIFPPLLVERRKSTRGYGRQEPRMLEAVETIRREACDGLTAAELAGRFKGTRQLFDLRFREATGHSPLDEIIHVRLQRVLELLSKPDFPISSIAAFCGFPSERMLQKHFRSHFRTTMRAWRKARR